MGFLRRRRLVGMGRVRFRRPDQPPALFLVTNAPDGPEEKHARRRSVRPLSGAALTTNVAIHR
jgi:hypothetical protein